MTVTRSLAKLAHRAALGFVIVLGHGLSGCSSTPTAPPVEIVTVSNFELADPAQQKQLPLRVTYPQRGSRLPIVIFSHGAYSSKDLYAPIADAWAKAGYIVIQPTHMDSVSLGVKRGSSDPRAWPSRLLDMKRIVEGLADIERRVPSLRGRMDPLRIIAAGHSFGGLVAQTIGGATFFDPTTQTTESRRQAHVVAVIIVSGAGRMAPQLRTEDWQSLQLPTLVTVGTNDLKQAPDRSGYEWRKEPYDLAPAGEKYLLTLEGADHYFGGTIGRDDLPIDPKGAQYLADFNAVSVAFLNAHVRGERRAATQLRSWAASESRLSASSLQTK